MAGCAGQRWIQNPPAAKAVYTVTAWGHERDHGE
eukprot:CAMPEP_0195323518 /NCGR_PEP_ID=MMETSP0708-20121125/7983_1 /TAXON_ID=33640 /ORGANISM="Asterionellopsis glacialis, Strain CCMP134" /LENGTH=33 /DNA_ID= /DNA_START= /DNA_END= /DNA_ORIENTATION=